MSILDRCMIAFYRLCAFDREFSRAVSAQGNRKAQSDYSLEQQRWLALAQQREIQAIAANDA